MRRGPLSEEVRRKFEAGVVDFEAICTGLLLPVEVREVVMAKLGVAVAVGVMVLLVVTSSSGGGVLGEQSSSSWRLAERKGSYLSPRPLFK